MPYTNIQLTEFLNAYITAALWSSSDGDNESLEEFEVADETRTKMKEDCLKFHNENHTLLYGLDPAQCGYDFWLTRCGHGVGFWDRDLGEVGDKLSEVCSKWGEVNLYITDDNQIDFR